MRFKVRVKTTGRVIGKRSTRVAAETMAIYAASQHGPVEVLDRKRVIATVEPESHHVAKA
jgi:hypothetical protein